MYRAFLLGILILVLVAGACGYGFRGGQNNLPGDVRTIAIPMFKNLTAEYRAERIVTDEVIYQFNRSQMLRVVSGGRADVVLEGTIKRSNVKDLALARDQSSAQRQIRLYISAKLVRSDNGKVLWEDRNLNRVEAFNVGGSPQATERNKREAIEDIAEELAKTMHDNILVNF